MLRIYNLVRVVKEFQRQSSGDLSCFSHLKHDLFYTLKIITIIFFIHSSLFFNSAQAQLTFEFQPNYSAQVESDPVVVSCGIVTNFSCIRGSGGAGAPASYDPDTTPFFEENIIVEGGNRYYHVLVGDPSSDFSLEYYIQQGWGTKWDNNRLDSASDGVYNGGLDATPLVNPDYVSPLSSLAGNGTGAPRKVMFRQTLRDLGFEQEVIKDALYSKPKITQSINDAELVSYFQVDMSNSDYDSMNTAGNIVNTMSITDASGRMWANFDQANGLNNMVDATTGGVWNSFDNTNFQGTSQVTAGKYIKTGGIGYDELFWFYTTYQNLSDAEAKIKAELYSKGSSGEYTYYEGGFDVEAVDWETYRNDDNVPDF